MRKGSAKIVISIFIFTSFVLAIYLYPKMPAVIASHWNIKGVVDGYLPKFWGLFLMPLISIVMALLFLVIPEIDPLKANIEKFKNYYEGFVILIIAFLFYLYLLTILWNLGFRFNLIRYLVPAFGALFYFCGILIENARRNWFIGIRTPWTLSDERVWDKTHKVTAKLFKISGLIALLGFIFTNIAFYFVVIPAIASSLYGFIYSYLEFRKK